MPRVLLLFVATAVCIVVFLVLRHPPLIRGLSGEMLFSPGQPDVAVRPAALFRLVDACRADPAVSSGQSTNARVTANVWYARYASSGDRARLLVMFASVDEPWTWHPTPRAPVAEPFRVKDIQAAGFEGVAATYALPPEADPWREDDEKSPWNRGSLVRRHVYQAHFLRFNVIVEYREPFPAGETPIQDDPAGLAAFEKRALDAFTLLRGKAVAKFPRPTENLPYPQGNVSRFALGKTLGPVVSGTEHR